MGWSVVWHDRLLQQYVWQHTTVRGVLCSKITTGMLRNIVCVRSAMREWICKVIVPDVCSDPSPHQRPILLVVVHEFGLTVSVAVACLADGCHSQNVLCSNAFSNLLLWSTD